MIECQIFKESMKFEKCFMKLHKGDHPTQPSPRTVLNGWNKKKYKTSKQMGGKYHTLRQNPRKTKKSAMNNY